MCSTDNILGDRGNGNIECERRSQQMKVNGERQKQNEESEGEEQYDIEAHYAITIIVTKTKRC